MVSIPKIIGLLSCGFLLCLGLSNAAPAVAEEEAGTPHTRQPDGPRVGGQGGQPAPGQARKGEAGKPHKRQKDSPRVGGQGGQPNADQAAKGEAGTPHTRMPGGQRVGGQGGGQ
jgi:hypothetical protein